MPIELLVTPREGGFQLKVDGRLATFTREGLKAGLGMILGTPVPVEPGQKVSYTLHSVEGDFAFDIPARLVPQLICEIETALGDDA